MRPETTPKPKPAKSSLTDSILTLCTSGRFGVREAIAIVTTPGDKTRKVVRRRQGLQKAG
jgi:hypothetical protein